MIYEEKNQTKAEALVEQLMQWYHENRRDLIWRKTREPYRIWISEIMAQQTRITAVLPYYERFIHQFPTVESLARAEEDEVLKAWEGLGYYSRARNLLKTAKRIVSEYKGEFPKQSKLLQKLPGIGEYTAGAIVSICFDERVPAVDGNVQRVFARLYENYLDISVPLHKKLLTEFVYDIMPNQQTGIFNQALMELGALVCLPKNPNCEECPVQNLCKSYANGTQKKVPVKAVKKAIPQEDKIILLIRNDKDEFLLRQRTEKLLNGLWEFYSIGQNLNESGIKNELYEKGISSCSLIPIGKAVHTFTHKRWNMKGYQCDIEGRKKIEGYHFFSREEIKKLAMPTALQFFRNWLEETTQMVLPEI